jgi:PIN domain nuclease of toxin-antitoxin system
MRILLDSHVFVWAKSAPQNLGDEARAAIIDPDNEAFISVASAWELWLKHARKPVPGLAPVLDGGAPAFLDAARESGFALLGITLDHAAAAAKLPPLHRDPFDRMLIAQAIAEKLTIVTADPAFRQYPGVHVLGT